MSQNGQVHEVLAGVRQEARGVDDGGQRVLAELGALAAYVRAGEILAQMDGVSALVTASTAATQEAMAMARREAAAAGEAVSVAERALAKVPPLNKHDKQRAQWALDSARKKQAVADQYAVSMEQQYQRVAQYPTTLRLLRQQLESIEVPDFPYLRAVLAIIFQEVRR
jgi:hypothetical protein